MQHGLATRELDKRARSEGFDLLLNLVEREGLAAGEGVLGVAPGAAKIATRETDEDARQAREGRFALNGFVELDEVHCGRFYS